MYAIRSYYDIIILSNLIGVVDDVEHVFNELHKVCHEKTRVIVTYYSAVWEPVIRLAECLRIKKKMPEQNWLSSGDISNLLYLAGFEAYKNNRNMLFPFRIPLFSTFLNRFVSRFPLINGLSLNQFVFARPFPKTKREEEKNTAYSVSVVRNNFV